MVFIPISAKDGDNVVNKSDKTPWYDVIRPISSQFPDYRGYAGRVSGGIIRPGDKIRVLPSGTESTVKSIDFRRGTPGGGVCPYERYADAER